MAKGWRKDDYNRQLFGQKVRDYRLTLQWSLGHLAQLSGINKGSLQHVEKGNVRLPDAKRQTVIDVLTVIRLISWFLHGFDTAGEPC